MGFREEEFKAGPLRLAWPKQVAYVTVFSSRESYRDSLINGS